MDGVLVDTGEIHYVSWVETLAKLDISFSRDFFRRTFGMNNTGVLTSLLDQVPSEEFVQEVGAQKEALFRDRIRGIATPLPGVMAWLSRLRAQGYSQAIASSAPQANIDALVGELGIRDYFDAILSGVDLPGKPDPAVFLHAASLLQSAPNQCIVVEDATAGVEGAKRAGMKCIAVTTTNPASALGAADLVVDQLAVLSPNAFRQLLTI
jgi:HAD superfamily hydrolase (TIGR01509 family)